MSPARPRIGEFSPVVNLNSRRLVVLALVLTGLSMRTAVTSVGAVLSDLEQGLHTSSAIAGIITTLPVLCFALIGSQAPRLAHQFGDHRVVFAALGITTVGLLARSVAGQVWLFSLLSVLALAGGAIANVLMPSLVKRHFPDRIGPMTAVYTTALAVGATAAAGLTVPIDHAVGGWRTGIGSWALLSAVAMVPWLATLRGDTHVALASTARISAGRLLHSKLAWALTLMFAFQSMQAYISLGWFANFFRDAGVSATRAGLLVAFLSSISIPISMVIPTLAAQRQRPIVVFLAATSLLAYIGMLIAPIDGAWLWMLLAGAGSGMFPLALTMIGLRSRDASTTAALSAFVQSNGYLIAGAGPVLVGVLVGATSSWVPPLLVLLAAAVISAVAGWYAGTPRYVDDDLGDLQTSARVRTTGTPAA
jgi:CP family cyanate transporter-like MFS transporter